MLELSCYIPNDQDILVVYIDKIHTVAWATLFGSCVFGSPAICARRFGHSLSGYKTPSRSIDDRLSLYPPELSRESLSSVSFPLLILYVVLLLQVTMHVSLYPPKLSLLLLQT